MLRINKTPTAAARMIANAKQAIVRISDCEQGFGAVMRGKASRL
jgi:hypothetical protein